ncbi:MAG: preprotein translocase subunit SecY [Planctomycetota bacterium]|jgi:preprotein translocase subunit SecY
MLQAILNIFKVNELRNKVLFTLGMLAVYRIGFWIPVPGINQEQLKITMQQQSTEGTIAGRALDYLQIFSGGSLGQSTIFGLGIMPYITAAIIFQLLVSMYEPLKKLKEEGPTGQQKIQEYTRYATIAMCVIQSIGWLGFINAQNLIYPQWAGTPLWWVMAVTSMTAGTVFLMWLAEQIDKYGIGNGASLVITAGILAQMPGAMIWVVNNSPIGQLPLISDMFSVDLNNTPQVSWLGVIFLIAAFILVVAGSVLITVAHRRIPVQQAKHTRGRRVYGGQRSFLPLRVNHGGVMPIIFASSILIFPSMALGPLQAAAQNGQWADWLQGTINVVVAGLGMGEFPYILIYIVMVYFFSYFWTTVQFNPEEMAKQLRDSGSFIPGLRPGPRTAEYIETVLERITYVGAGFLSIIAVIPMIVGNQMNIPFNVSSFLGGTGLLIVVAVGLDFIQRIEASLLMHNYAGFLGEDEKTRRRAS